MTEFSDDAMLHMCSITQNLKSLGYTDEDLSTELDFVEWNWESLMEQPRQLTDRGKLLFFSLIVRKWGLVTDIY